MKTTDTDITWFTITLHLILRFNIVDISFEELFETSHKFLNDVVVDIYHHDCSHESLLLSNISQFLSVPLRNL